MDSAADALALVVLALVVAWAAALLQAAAAVVEPAAGPLALAVLAPVVAWAAALLQAAVVETAAGPLALAVVGNLQIAVVESAGAAGQLQLPLPLAVLTPVVACAVAQVLQAALVEPASGPLALAVLAFVAALAVLAGSGESALALPAGSLAMLLAQPVAAAPFPQLAIAMQEVLLRVPKDMKVINISGSKLSGSTKIKVLSINFYSPVQTMLCPEHSCCKGWLGLHPSNTGSDGWLLPHQDHCLTTGLGASFKEFSTTTTTTTTKTKSGTFYTIQ